DPKPAAAQPRFGGRARARRRRAARRLRQRHPDRPRRGGGDQRPLRRAPDRRGQPERADPETALIPAAAIAAVPAAMQAATADAGPAQTRTEVLQAVPARPATAGQHAPELPGMGSAVAALLLVLALIVGLS